MARALPAAAMYAGLTGQLGMARNTRLPDGVQWFWLSSKFVNVSQRLRNFDKSASWIT
jgi:hypothetical protein